MNIPIPLQSGTSNPQGYALYKMTGCAALLRAPIPNEDAAVDKMFEEAKIVEQSVSENNQELLINFLNERSTTFYIEPKTKGAEYPGQQHLGADKLLQRKPMICTYGLIYTLFHKDLVDALKQENIAPSNGDYVPVVLKTEDGAFECKDYCWLKMGAFAHEQKWACGYYVEEGLYSNWFLKRTIPAIKGYIPTCFALESVPDGDFWLVNRLRGDFLFSMSPRAKSVLDKFQSPYKKYQKRYYAELYDDAQKSPLGPGIIESTSKIVDKEKKTLHERFRIQELSRSLNPGEKIPDYLKPGMQYIYDGTLTRKKQWIDFDTQDEDLYKWRIQAWEREKNKNNPPQ